MNFLPVPKLLKWNPSIPQHYTTDKKFLIVSGCSFTANTLDANIASTWPGFVLDRCGFDHVRDWSFPGVGNEYIGNSILYQCSRLSKEELDNCMVIVMWSGLNRISHKEPGSTAMPNINGVKYTRTSFSTETYNDIDTKFAGARESADKIFEVKEYLESKNIPFVFSFYCNLLFSPYLPKRDSTHEFEGFVDKDTLAQLRSIPWIPNQPMDFMFEYGFKNDLLGDDLFHPGVKCSERWTDDVLLAGMVKRGLITKI